MYEIDFADESSSFALDFRAECSESERFLQFFDLATFRV